MKTVHLHFTENPSFEKYDFFYFFTLLEAGKTYLKIQSFQLWRKPRWCFNQTSLGIAWVFVSLKLVWKMTEEITFKVINVMFWEMGCQSFMNCKFIINRQNWVISWHLLLHLLIIIYKVIFFHVQSSINLHSWGSWSPGAPGWGMVVSPFCFLFVCFLVFYQDSLTAQWLNWAKR